MGGWVKEERRKHGQQGFCLASLPWTQERGCPHKPGVRPRERERGCPAGLSTGDHASSTSRPPPVHVRCRWARKQLRGCLQTRAGHQRRGKGLLSASPVGAQWDKVKTPWGPRENPPAGATERGSGRESHQARCQNRAASMFPLIHVSSLHANRASKPEVRGAASWSPMETARGPWSPVTCITSSTI